MRAPCFEHHEGREGGRGSDGTNINGWVGAHKIRHRGGVLIRGMSNEYTTANKLHTLPNTMRPRPPLAAHSSLAARSSLPGRIVRQRVVIL